jgi:hypothetical protein
MMDQGGMESMFWSMFTRQTADWKPEYKEVLHNTAVDVIRQKEHLRVVVKPGVDGHIANEIQEYLLKISTEIVTRIMGGYKCQVRKFE